MLYSILEFAQYMDPKNEYTQFWNCANSKTEYNIHTADKGKHGLTCRAPVLNLNVGHSRHELLSLGEVIRIDEEPASGSGSDWVVVKVHPIAPGCVRALFLAGINGE